MKKEILRLNNIVLFSYGIKTLDYLSMNLFEGEVLSVVGASHSGMSSLMKILAGIIKPHEGQIILNGKAIEFSSSMHAMKNGICYIEEEPNIVPKMSIADNILVGKKSISKIYFNKKLRYNYIKGLADIVGLTVDLNKMANQLTYVQRKLVGIARALAGNHSIFIMDNPTSLLHEKEINLLVSIIKKLKSRGISIVISSHKLKEILEVSDRIMVLRNGLPMGIHKSKDCSQKKLIVSMLGRDMISEQNPEPRNRDRTKNKNELLRVEDLSVPGLLNHINFNLYQGEILGIVGLMDSGKSELADVIFGLNTKHTGQIFINNKKVNIKSPRDALKLKIGVLPKGKKINCFIENFRINQNVSLSSFNRITKHGILNHNLEDYLAKYYLEQVGINPNLYNKKLDCFSEGSQVKIEIAKILAIKPHILILNEPTFGIDIISRKEICDLLNAIKKEMGIILISSEMEDVIELFDRLLVMNNGHIVAEMTGCELQS
jgi:ABC-type sugar transport system ATPase subunit